MYDRQEAICRASAVATDAKTFVAALSSRCHRQGNQRLYFIAQYLMTQRIKPDLEWVAEARPQPPHFFQRHAFRCGKILKWRCPVPYVRRYDFPTARRFVCLDSAVYRAKNCQSTDPATVVNRRICWTDVVIDRFASHNTPIGSVDTVWCPNA